MNVSRINQIGSDEVVQFVIEKSATAISSGSKLEQDWAVIEVCDQSRWLVNVDFLGGEVCFVGRWSSA